MTRRLSIFSIAVIAIIMLSGTSLAFAKEESIIKFNKDIEISKEMAVDDVVAVGGNITISGRVKNSAVAVGGSIFLKPGSFVGGEVVVVGGSLVQDEGSEIAGKVTHVDMPNFLPSINTFMKGGWITLWAAVGILALVGFLGLAILLSALIPEHMGTVVNALEKSFANMLLWGIFWTILIVPIAVLLAISIIGIILIPLEILLAALAFIIGYIAAAVYIGKNILLSFKKIPPPFVDVIVGIIILFLASLVPVIGPVIKLIFAVAGFGAVMKTRFGTVK